MKKTALLIMLLTIISNIFGFAKDIALTYFYGESNISDAYLISLTIPTVIFSIIATGVSTGYIPIYINLEKKYGNKSANKFTSNLINIVIVFSIVLFIFGFIFAKQIVKIFASGFTGDTLKMAVSFSRISIASVFFLSLIYIGGSFLQMKNNYIIPAIMAIPYDIVVIISIWLSKQGNIYILSIGTVIAFSSELILAIPFMIKKGYKHRFIFNFKDPEIIYIINLTLPLMVGVSVNQINLLVDRTIASNIRIGGISSLTYAARINGFVQGIFVISITSVMFPIISKLVCENKINNLKKTIRESLKLIMLLLIPSTVAIMIFSSQIVKLLFGHGSFDKSAINNTSNALFFYAIGIIAFGIREVLVKVFYSMQDTKTPMKNAVVGVIINIIINITISKWMGINGLALASSISAIVSMLLMFVSIRKVIGSIGIYKIRKEFFKILFASIVMGLVSEMFFELNKKTFGEIGTFIITVIIGIFVYSIVIYYLKIEEVDFLVKRINSIVKFKKGKHDKKNKKTYYQ